MAVSNFDLYVYSNGRKIRSTKDAEALFKSLSVSSNGVDNGATITEDGTGNFIFNAKNLTSILAGSATGHAVEFDQFTTGLGTKLDASQKGAASGVAPLGADSKIPSAYIPAIAITSTSVVADEAARFALAGTVQEGDVAVQTDISKTFIMNGSGDGSLTAHWTEILTGGAVISVNGFTGAVSLDSDDIAEGVSNFYWTQARFDSAFTAKSTSDLSEGTNLYFTSQRVVEAAYRETYTNNSGATILSGEICRLNASGELVKVSASDALDKGDEFVIPVADILNAASGECYISGAKISGLNAATVGSVFELSRITAGGKTVTPQTFGSTEHLVILGRVVSATEWRFSPVYEAEFL